MKKLLLILLCLPFLFTTCKKEEDGPIINNIPSIGIEQIIVDKIWKGKVPEYQSQLFGPDIIFELKSNDSLYTYTVDCSGYVSTTIGTWNISGKVITYNFVSNSTEYINLPFGELTEYSDTQLKFKQDTNVNAICKIYNLNTLNCTYIPDDNFELKLIQLGYDDFSDNYVLTSNINALTFLQVSFSNISDLTGIEDFSALTTLDCSNNQLTSLDLDQNTALAFLNCSSNQLTSHKIFRNNTALTTLYCSYNQLTSLDLDQNTALTYLDCSYNQLTSHKIFRNNTALTNLVCGSNEFTNLDVSDNTALEVLNCDYNYLTSLDMSNNLALLSLDCKGNFLTELDVSQNTALEGLYCRNNQLTSLDVRNGNNTIINDFYVSNNPNLYCIDVDNPAWSTTYWWSIDAQSYFSEDCN